MMISITEAPIEKGTRVFTRLDLDVPLENGSITETFRLDHVIQTPKYIIDMGGIPIIAGHIDRPKGKHEDSLSTKYLRPYFDKNLGKGKYELLENLRFDPREEANDPEYAKELAQKAELYVNDSFATCHREHASIVGVPSILPAYAGYRLQIEIKTLESILEIENSPESPMRPLVAIIGGAKLESKKPVIDKFVEIADHVLIGGKIGLDWNGETYPNLHLPKDYATDNKDIGPKTIEEYIGIILKANTVVWAGPMGMYEDPNFLNGTGQLAYTLTESAATSIVSGGDTIAALHKISILSKIDFVSTGGGAMLQFLAKGTLPGIEALGREQF